MKFALAPLWACILIAQTTPSVALSVSSSSVLPGRSTQISISNTNINNAQPTGFQFTLNYSATAATAVSQATGFASNSAGKTITCNPKPGILTCIIAGLNVTPIGNGDIADIGFSTKGTANIALTLSGVTVTDATGNAIANTFTNGIINIMNVPNQINPLAQILQPFPNTVVFATHDQIHAGESTCTFGQSTTLFNCTFGTINKALNKYTVGMQIVIVVPVGVNCPGACQIAIDNNPITSLKQNDGVTDQALLPGHIYIFMFDGNVFRIPG